MNPRPLSLFADAERNTPAGFLAFLDLATLKGKEIDNDPKKKKKNEDPEAFKRRMDEDKFQWLEEHLAEHVKKSQDSSLVTNFVRNLAWRVNPIRNWLVLVADPNIVRPAATGEVGPPIVGIVCGRHRMMLLIVLKSMNLLSASWLVELETSRPLVYQLIELPYLIQKDDVLRSMSLQQIPLSNRDILMRGFTALIQRGLSQKQEDLLLVFNQASLDGFSDFSIIAFRSMDSFIQFLKHTVDRLTLPLGVDICHKLLEAFVNHSFVQERNLGHLTENDKLHYMIKALGFLQSCEQKIWRHVNFFTAYAHWDDQVVGFAGFLWKLSPIVKSKQEKKDSLLRISLETMFLRSIASFTDDSSPDILSDPSVYANDCIAFLQSRFCKVNKSGKTKTFDTFFMPYLKQVTLRDEPKFSLVFEFYPAAWSLSSAKREREIDPIDIVLFAAMLLGPPGFRFRSASGSARPAYPGPLRCCNEPPLKPEGTEQHMGATALRRLRPFLSHSEGLGFQLEKYLIAVAQAEKAEDLDAQIPIVQTFLQSVAEFVFVEEPDKRYQRLVPTFALLGGKESAMVNILHTAPPLNPVSDDEGVGGGGGGGEGGGKPEQVVAVAKAKQINLLPAPMVAPTLVGGVAKQKAAGDVERAPAPRQHFAFEPGMSAKISVEEWVKLKKEGILNLFSFTSRDSSVYENPERFELLVNLSGLIRVIDYSYIHLFALGNHVSFLNNLSRVLNDMHQYGTAHYPFEALCERLQLYVKYRDRFVTDEEEETNAEYSKFLKIPVIRQPPSPPPSPLRSPPPPPVPVVSQDIDLEKILSDGMENDSEKEENDSEKVELEAKEKEKQKGSADDDQEEEEEGKEKNAEDMGNAVDEDEDEDDEDERVPVTKRESLAKSGAGGSAFRPLGVGETMKENQSLHFFLLKANKSTLLGKAVPYHLYGSKGGKGVSGLTYGRGIDQTHICILSAPGLQEQRLGESGDRKFQDIFDLDRAKSPERLMVASSSVVVIVAPFDCNSLLAAQQSVMQAWGTEELLVEHLNYQVIIESTEDGLPLTTSSIAVMFLFKELSESQACLPRLVQEYINQVGFGSNVLFTNTGFCPIVSQTVSASIDLIDQEGTFNVQGNAIEFLLSMINSIPKREIVYMLGESGLSEYLQVAVLAPNATVFGLDMTQDVKVEHYANAKKPSSFLSLENISDVKRDAHGKGGVYIQTDIVIVAGEYVSKKNISKRGGKKRRKPSQSGEGDGEEDEKDEEGEDFVESGESSGKKGGESVFQSSLPSSATKRSMAIVCKPAVTTFENANENPVPRTGIRFFPDDIDLVSPSHVGTATRRLLNVVMPGTEGAYQTQMAGLAAEFLTSETQNKANRRSRSGSEGGEGDSEKRRKTDDNLEGEEAASVGAEDEGGGESGDGSSEDEVAGDQKGGQQEPRYDYRDRGNKKINYAK